MPEHTDSRSTPPSAADVIANRTSPSCLRSEVGHHEGKQNHPGSSERHSQRASRPCDRGDNAEEECDVDERPDREALADELGQHKALGTSSIFKM
jgi:hypothetical protein